MYFTYSSTNKSAIRMVVDVSTCVLSVEAYQALGWLAGVECIRCSPPQALESSCSWPLDYMYPPPPSHSPGPPIHTM